MIQNWLDSTGETELSPEMLSRGTASGDLQMRAAFLAAMNGLLLK